MAWPVRSGLVPPLAESFTTRPDTGPGLEAALVPGAAVALVSGEDAGSAPDWPGIIRHDPARGSPGRLAMAVTRSRPAGLGGGQQPGLDPVRLTPGCRGPRLNGCGSGARGPEGGMRVHSGLPVPIPRPRRFRPRYRDVSRDPGESVLSEVGGSKNGRHADADRELDGDRRLGLSRPAGGGPAVEMMSVTGVGTVMLRRPPAEIGVVRVLNPPGPEGC